MIQPGEHLRFNLRAGEHEFWMQYAGTDFMLGEKTTYNVCFNGWWYSQGCDNGTRPGENGVVHTGMGPYSAVSPINIHKVEWYLDATGDAYRNRDKPLNFACDFTLYYRGECPPDSIAEIGVGIKREDVWWNYFGDDIHAEESGKTLLNTLNYCHREDYKRSAMPVGIYTAKVIFNDGAVFHMISWSVFRENSDAKIIPVSSAVIIRLRRGNSSGHFSVLMLCRPNSTDLSSVYDSGSATHERLTFSSGFTEKTEN